MRHDFAPRRVAEMLDDAIALVKTNWRSVLGMSAVVLLPVAAAYSVIASFYIRSFFELMGASVSAASTGAIPEGPPTTMLVTAFALQGMGLLYALAKAMFDSTLFSSSPELLEDRRLPLKVMLGRGLKNVVPVVVVQFLVGLLSGAIAIVVMMVVFFGGIALIALSPAAGIIGILGAYLLAGACIVAVGSLLALAVPVVVIEGGIGAAVGRSFRLVRRHFWRVLFIVLAVGALGAQFESALAAPTLLRELVTGVQQPAALLREIAWGWKVFDGVMQGIAIAVVLPFTSSVMLLTYLDLRARDEGMDLLVRARELTPA
jgi:hypothetical protein